MSTKNNQSVLNALKTKIEMPAEIWNGEVCGPCSFDDPFEIYFYFQEKRNGPITRKRIIIKDFELVEGF